MGLLVLKVDPAFNLLTMLTSSFVDPSNTYLREFVFDLSHLTNLAPFSQDAATRQHLDAADRQDAGQGRLRPHRHGGPLLQGEPRLLRLQRRQRARLALPHSVHRRVGKSQEK